MAVSTSLGGEFKVTCLIRSSAGPLLSLYVSMKVHQLFLKLQAWVYYSDIQHKDQVHQKSGWRCQSVGSYKYVLSDIQQSCCNLHQNKGLFIFDFH